MSTARKLASLFALLALLAACKPVETPQPAGLGYRITFSVLGPDSRDTYLVRDIECSVLAYAGGEPVLIVDTAGGQGVDALDFEVRTNPRTVAEIQILDQVGADAVEFICTMIGHAGDSLECEVTYADSGKLAPLLGSQDFDLIEQKDGVATCAGTISLRA